MRGGPRKGAGRPTGTTKPDAKRRQVCMRMTAAAHAKAAAIGGGNASEGLRLALAAYAAPTIKPR
jgi:hypothetical protein